MGFMREHFPLYLLEGLVTVFENKPKHISPHTVRNIVLKLLLDVLVH